MIARCKPSLAFLQSNHQARIAEINYDKKRQKQEICLQQLEIHKEVNSSNDRQDKTGVNIMKVNPIEKTSTSQIYEVDVKHNSLPPLLICPHFLVDFERFTFDDRNVQWGQSPTSKNLGKMK